MQISVLSTVYVEVPVSSTPHDPTGDPVYMAFVAQGVTPSSGDWNVASWVADASPPTAACLVGPVNGGVVLPAGIYVVWVRITDSPEVPAIPAGGTLTVF